MKASEVKPEWRESGVRLSASVSSQLDRDRELYYTFNLDDPSLVAVDPDPIAATLLVPAMRRHEDLAVEGEVSRRLAFNLPRIRDICHTWWKPEFSRVSINVAERTTAEPPPRPTGATFFSGGVDSFYTLLKHKKEPSKVPLTHLIFLRGVETRLNKIGDTSFSEDWVRQVALRTGTAVITGETNVRSVANIKNYNVHWEPYYHGHALAAIGMFFAKGLGHICIPSAFTYNHLVAHGSSPLTDEMYSTERQIILHDGSEASRAEKVKRIVEWDRDLVLQYLRVCLNNSGAAYNCGRCRKCVRTAVPLYAMGLLERSNFKDKRMDHWEAVMMRDHVIMTEENLTLAREVDADPKLIALLEKVVHRVRHNNPAKQ